MAGTNPNMIFLTGNYPVTYEEAAASALLPGMLIELDADGDVQPHSSAGGRGLKSFADFAGFEGKTIDDEYAADDRVPYRIAQEGSKVYAWLKIGAKVNKNAALQSAGNGTLEGLGQDGSPSPDAAAADEVVIAYAAEAKDNSGGSAAMRITVFVA